MRALVQRVSSSCVVVDGAERGRIGRGLTILLGVTHEDSEKEADFLAEKAAGLRIFEDDAGKMNLSVRDVGGAALVVSQFTLYADARKGKRPSFDAAARPEPAEALYLRFVAALRERGIPVETGVFGADMKLEIHNDGPVTILLEK